MRRRSATPPRDVAGVKPSAVSVRTAAFRLVWPLSSATLSEAAAAALTDDDDKTLALLAPFRLAVAADLRAETIEARMDSGLEGGVRS